MIKFRMRGTCLQISQVCLETKDQDKLTQAGHWKKGNSKRKGRHGGRGRVKTGEAGLGH